MCSGEQGLPGKPGANSVVPGPAGQKGEQGAAGPMGLTGSKGVKGESSGGVQYVRWGRTTCPRHAILVYSGKYGANLRLRYDILYFKKKHGKIISVTL